MTCALLLDVGCFFFFKKKSKIQRSLAQLTKRKKVKTKINRIRNEQENITTDTKEIQDIIRKYFNTLYSTKVENLGEIEFLDLAKLPKLNQEVNHLDRPKTNEKEMEKQSRWTEATCTENRKQGSAFGN